eukprot:2816330-Rhodomonas_salina.5
MGMMVAIITTVFETEADTNPKHTQSTLEGSGVNTQKKYTTCLRRRGGPQSPFLDPTALTGARRTLSAAHRPDTASHLRSIHDPSQHERAACTRATLQLKDPGT